MITYGKIALVDNVGAEMLDRIDRAGLGDLSSQEDACIGCKETVAAYTEDDELGKFVKDVLAEVDTDTDYIYFIE